jgi:hypothetical protein
VPSLCRQQAPLRLLHHSEWLTVRLLQELPAGRLAALAAAAQRRPVRALIALYPEEWRAALQGDPDHGELTEGGGSDVA